MSDVTAYNWLGTTSSDPTVSTNWSPEGVPGTGDDATFGAAGDGNACTLTAAWALGNLSVEAGYTSKLDLATYNLTMDDGGDIILDGAGEFDFGSSTVSITNGTFDALSVATFTSGTAAFVFSGTCEWYPKKFSRLYDGTVSSNGTLTIGPIASGNFGKFNALTLGDGSTLSVPQTVTGALDNGLLVTGENSQITGDGTFQLTNCLNGAGFTSRGTNTTIDVANFAIEAQTISPILATGAYQSAGRVYGASSSNERLDLSAGSYTFDSLEVEATSTGTVTLDTSTNNASVSVQGDFTVDIDSTGDIVLDDSSSTGTWTLQGDIVDEITGAGTFTWTGSNPVTLSGTADQDIAMNSWVAEPTFDINKSAGVVTLSEGTMTLGANSDHAGLVIDGASSTLDCDTYNLAGADGADIIGANSGNIDFGSGLLTLNNGDLDIASATVTRGTASFLATGDGDHAFDTANTALGDLTINKSAGTLTFATAFTFDSFLRTAGAVNFGGGLTHTTIGDFTISSTDAIDSTGLDTNTFTVGGNALIRGVSDSQKLAFEADTLVTIDATGTCTARYVELKNCTAGVTEGIAHDSIDNTGNINWSFVFTPVAGMGLGLDLTRAFDGFSGR